MGRVTVKTLAATLGVSAATVSNAYNRPDQLSAELRERILATAAELGYAGPDAAARALRVGRSGAVGVVLNERLSYAFSDPYAIEFLAGLTEVAEREQVSLLLMPMPLPGGPADPRLADTSAVQRAAVDAMTLLCLPAGHPVLEVARTRGIRVVGPDVSADPAASWVAIDDESAGRLLGEHLASLGHRRAVAVVDSSAPAGGPVRDVDVAQLAYPDYAARVRGLAAALPGGLRVVTAGHNAVESGLSAGRTLLAGPDRPGAVVCLSDVLALGVLAAAAELGVDVPGEVSVCGVDDVAQAAAADLTTVRQPVRERGRQVGRLLVDPEASPRQVLLPIELVVRGSTGPASRR